jgi:hypothetical protein
VACLNRIPDLDPHPFCFGHRQCNADVPCAEHCVKMSGQQLKSAHKDKGKDETHAGQSSAATKKPGSSGGASTGAPVPATTVLANPAKGAATIAKATGAGQHTHVGSAIPAMVGEGGLLSGMLLAHQPVLLMVRVQG